MGTGGRNRGHEPGSGGWWGSPTILYADQWKWPLLASKQTGGRRRARRNLKEQVQVRIGAYLLIVRSPEGRSVGKYYLGPRGRE